MDFRVIFLKKYRTEKSFLFQIFKFYEVYSFFQPDQEVAVAPIVSLLLQNSILLAWTGFTHALSSVIASSISSKVFS